MKKYYLILWIFINLIILAGAKDNKLHLNTFYSKEEINRVLKGDIISRMYIKYNAKDENTHLRMVIPATKYVNEDFSIYEASADEKAFVPYKLTNESKIKLYNILMAFSKLKGMKYYSMTDRKIEQLIINSYRIESFKNTKEISDPNSNKILPKIKNYFLLQDDRFGRLIYKSELYNEGNNFIMINSCEQPLKSIVVINNANEYKIISYMIYNNTRHGFFLYSIVAVRIRNNFLLKNVLSPTTFSTRLRAATIHIVKEMGIDWNDKLNPWNEEKLKKGEYKTY